MPHIRIEVHYTPVIEHYPGAVTAADAMRQDIASFEDRCLDLEMLIDSADRMEVTLVED